MSFHQTPFAEFPAASAASNDPSRSVLIAATGLALALLMPSLVALGLDERTINGITVWSKPVKFQLSFGLLFVTVLMVLPLLPRAELLSRHIRWPAAATAFAGVFEITYVSLQAARGRASHWNNATDIETFMYSAMAWFSVLAVMAPAYIGWRFWRAVPRTGQHSVHIGAALGLMLGGFATLLTAFVMGAGLIDGPGHWVGGLKTDAYGLPIVGWSRTGGDLRVPHFFATHIMQALPVLGLVADRFWPQRAVPMVWLGAVASIIVVFLTFIQAVSGVPFLPLEFCVDAGFCSQSREVRQSRLVSRAFL